MKDNRSCSREGGRRLDLFADETGPVGTCLSKREGGDCDSKATWMEAGSNVIRYEIPLNEADREGGICTRDTVLFQSIHALLPVRPRDGRGGNGYECA